MSLDQVETAIRKTLPQENLRAEREGNPQKLIEFIHPLIQMLLSAFQNQRSRMIRKRVFRSVGFLVGSLERHLQGSGLPKGKSFEIEPDAEHLLAAVGEELDMPPILGVNEYWLDDYETPAMTFTGSEGEIDFKAGVQEWARQTAIVADDLRPVADGDIDIESTKSRDAILRSSLCYQTITERYEKLVPSPARHRSGMSMEVFQAFRVYLCGYSVAGESYFGPNAANLAANFSADFITGMADESYLAMFRERLPYLSPMDRAQVVEDSRRDSVVDQLLTRVGLDRGSIKTLSDTEIASRIGSQSEAYFDVLTHYSALYKEISRLNSKHWGSITVLKKFSETTPDGSTNNAPVSPMTSVSDAPHGRPEMIYKMRRENPVVKKLLAGLALHRSERSA